MKNLFKSVLAAMLAITMVVLPSCTGDETPARPLTDLEKALAAKDGTECTINEALVYLVYDGIVVLGKSGKYMLIDTLDLAAPEEDTDPVALSPSSEELNPGLVLGESVLPAVGDCVNISGVVEKSMYFGVNAYTKDAVITVLSSGNDVSLPEPKTVSYYDYDNWVKKKGFEYNSTTAATTMSKEWGIEYINIIGIYDPLKDVTVDDTTGVATSLTVLDHGVKCGVEAPASVSIFNSFDDEPNMFAAYNPTLDEEGNLLTNKVKMTCWAVGAQVNNSKGVIPVIVTAVNDAPKDPRMETDKSSVILPSGGVSDTEYKVMIFTYDTQAVPTASCNNKNITVTVNPESYEGGGDQGMERYIGYYLYITAPANPSEENTLSATITLKLEHVKLEIPLSQPPHIKGEEIASPFGSEGAKGVMWTQFGLNKVLFDAETKVLLGTTSKGTEIYMTFDNKSGKCGWYKNFQGTSAYLNFYENDSFTISTSNPNAIVRKFEIEGFDEKPAGTLVADSGEITLSESKDIYITHKDGSSHQYSVTPSVWIGRSKAPKFTVKNVDKEDSFSCGWSAIWWCNIIIKE